MTVPMQPPARLTKQQIQQLRQENLRMYGPRRRSIEVGDTVIDTTNADQPVIVERIWHGGRWATVAWRDGNGIERGEIRRINVLRPIEATT